MIYTNLDINNMTKEIETHFKGVTNKEYMKNCIETHFRKFRLITKQEYDYLMKKYVE